MTAQSAPRSHPRRAGAHPFAKQKQETSTEAEPAEHSGPVFNNGLLHRLQGDPPGTDGGVQLGLHRVLLLLIPEPDLWPGPAGSTHRLR